MQVVRFLPVLLLSCTAIAAAQAPNSSSSAETPQSAPKRLPAFIKPLPADAPKPSSDPRDLKGMWLQLERKPERTATAEGQTPPYTATAKAALDVKQQAAAKGSPLVNNAVLCRPTGFLWELGIGYFPLRIMQTEQEIVFIFERFHGIWRILMNASQSKPDQPSYMGRSAGHWEGDTLVVDTVGFPHELWLDESGTLISEAAHLTSRIRKHVQSGELEILTTIDDPKTYTRPWTLRQVLNWRPDYLVLAEHDCEESSGSIEEAKQYGYSEP